eukprot:6188844-Pleurochrysis_carterae.AAC.1
MEGGGRKFPRMPRQHVCCKPIRKRVMHCVCTPANKAAARTMAAELKNLQRVHAHLVAIHERLKASFSREIDLHVRTGVRRSRIASDSAIHEELTKLREDLVFLRRDARYARSAANQKALVDKLKLKVDERDNTITLLSQKVFALEKRDTLHQRRLSNVTSTMDTHVADHQARELELLQQLKYDKDELASARMLRESELSRHAEYTEQLQAKAKLRETIARLEVACVKAEAKAAAKLAKTEAKATAKELKLARAAAEEPRGQLEAVEQSDEDALSEMEAEHDAALQQANTRVASVD